MARQHSSQLHDRLGSLGLSWPLLVATVACLGFPLFTTSQILADPDTYLHLSSGDWILRQQAVPSVDPFSYTLAGRPWIAHEWLAQAALALVHQLGGWTSLAWLASACFALTLACLLRFLLQHMPPIYALLFTALAAVALVPHLLARPHVLAWPALVLWVTALVKASETGQAPPKWLLGVLVLWANLHGSFTLGLVMVLPLALEAWLNSPAGQRRRTLKDWGGFIGLSWLAALLTPAGWKGIWFTLHLITLKHLKAISEWAPTSFAGLNPLELWLVVLLGLGLLGRLRLPPLRLLLLLGLLHQALAHVRYVSIFGLLTPILLAGPFGRLYPSLAAGQPAAPTLDRVFEQLATPAKHRSVALAVVLAVAVFTAQAGRHQPPESSTPKAALAAALLAGATGPVLNYYNFGGYLIFRGIPVFIDGRADFYGDEHMGNYLDAVEQGKAEPLQKILDDFKIGWTLLPPDSPALHYLNSRSEWQKIHQDKTAVVHIRQRAP